MTAPIGTAGGQSITGKVFLMLIIHAFTFFKTFLIDAYLSTIFFFALLSLPTPTAGYFPAILRCRVIGAARLDCKKFKPAGRMGSQLDYPPDGIDQLPRDIFFRPI